MTTLSIMFISGEASGDGLAAELLHGIREECAHSPWTVKAFGAGGEHLKKEGADIAVDLTKHAVVGIWEVLKHFKILKSLFLQLLDLAIQQKPQIIVLVDYPGFNLRFAKALKKHVRAHPELQWNPKIVQFISPQIWAWHESRIHQIARDMDMILSIFPFEKNWYAQRAPQLRVEYVGHPLMDRYKQYADQVAKRNPTEPYHVLLLPGSREKELGRHLPVLERVIPMVAQQVQTEFRLVASNKNLIASIKKTFANIPSNISLSIQQGGLAESLLWADAAIASSGTVTMECAYFQVPTVILYKTSFLTALLGHLFIHVKCIGMPNLLLNNKLVYPEFIQQDATPEKISQATIRFLTQPNVRQDTQTDLRKMLSMLGGQGACRRAAKQVLTLVNAQN